MADKPILFSGQMVSAILDGRKTQTRRAIKNAPEVPYMDKVGPTGFQFTGEGGLPRIPFTPPYAVGDRLWVREMWNAFWFSQDGDEAWPCDKIPTLAEIKEIEEAAHRVSPPQIVYRESDRAREWFVDQKWRPSIHMPRWASRLTLIVEDVRVQRLREITLGDICNEGLATSIYDFKPATRGFDAWADLWDGLNAKSGYGWDANPWVAAVSFRTIRANIDSEDVRNAA